MCSDIAICGEVVVDCDDVVGLFSPLTLSGCVVLGMPQVYASVGDIVHFVCSVAVVYDSVGRVNETVVDCDVDV